MSLCYVGEPPKRRHMIEESFGKSLRTSRGCLSFRGHQLGRDSPFLGSRQSVPASHAVIINEELRATKSAGGMARAQQKKNVTVTQI